MRGTARKVAVFLTATSLAVLATGCGRGNDDGGAGKVPGVSSDPCPNAVDDSKGCIYLGVISDFTGAFKGIGVPLTAGQTAYWDAVNNNGGIGDYEVDVTTHVEDNEYSPDTHAEAFAGMKDDVLALAQSLGSAQTAGILADAKAEDILIAPVSLTSGWLFEDDVIEIGTNYCSEAMNIVDYAVDTLGAKSVAAVHFPGDYGDDAAVGVRIAAEARGIAFTDVPTEPGEDQTAAIAGVLKSKADVVVVTTGPVEMATVLGGSMQQGFTGRFIGSIPTWNVALLDTPAKEALQANYLQASSIGNWDADTPGHEAMRAAASAAGQDPNEWFMLGWATGYAMKAVLDKAVSDGDLTREGMIAAATSLDSIDTEQMLPDGTGNFAGDPNETAVRSTLLNKVDPKASTGVSEEVAPFVGPTAESYDFKEPCYTQY